MVKLLVLAVSLTTLNAIADGNLERASKILSYYNGESFAHHYEDGNEDKFGRKGLYAGEKENTFTPSAVKHGFTDGLVTTRVLEGSGTELLQVEIEAESPHTYFNLRELMATEDAHVISRSGEENWSSIRDYLLDSLKAEHREEIKNLIVQYDGKNFANSSKLYQIIAFDTSAEVIGIEVLIIEFPALNKSIVIRWAYTHS